PIMLLPHQSGSWGANRWSERTEVRSYSNSTEHGDGRSRATLRAGGEDAFARVAWLACTNILKTTRGNGGGGPAVGGSRGDRSDQARATCAGADNLCVRNGIAATIGQQQGDRSTRGG